MQTLVASAAVSRLVQTMGAICLRLEIEDLQNASGRRDDAEAAACLHTLRDIAALRDGLARAMLRRPADAAALSDIDLTLVWLDRILTGRTRSLSRSRRARLLAAPVRTAPGGEVSAALHILRALRPVAAAGMIGAIALPIIALPAAATDLVCDTSGAVIVCDAILDPPAGTPGLDKISIADDASSGSDGGLYVSAHDGHDGDTGEAITITFSGQITTIDTSGIQVLSQGGLGGKGGDGYLGASSGDGGRGGMGGEIKVDNQGVLHVSGDYTAGLVVVSSGGDGGKGGGDIVSIDGNGGEGGQGGYGGFVDLTNHGAIYTDGGYLSSGIIAQSRGGTGGNGGNSIGFGSTGGEAGKGADANTVRVVNYGSIETRGSYSNGVLAQSIGGFGGGGGTAFGIAISGGDGRTAGNGNFVIVQNGGSIVTYGDHSEGILAQSIGGGGGRGGDAGGLGALGGYGGAGGTAADVFVRSTELIATHGDNSSAMKAQSIGGGGGDGGRGFGVAVIGGSGAGGGNGGAINADISGVMTTDGDDSSGIWAQSVGGGGGSGGGAIGGSLWSGFAVGGSAAQGGDGGGVFVNAAVNENSVDGNITTTGDRAFGIFAQSIGGGGGHGGYAISGAIGLEGAASVAVGGTGGAGGNGGVVLTRYKGTIDTAGDDATALLVQSVGGGGGTGGYAISLAASLGGALSSAVGGSGDHGGDGGAIGTYSWSDIHTAGDRAYGVMAQSIGGGGGGGGFSATAGAGLSIGALGVGLGGSGKGGGNGGQVDAFNYGNITTGGYQAHALSAQSLGGGGGNGGISATFAAGGFNAAAVNLGGSGGQGGLGGRVGLTNTAILHTLGDNAHGLFAQSVGGGGGSGGLSVAGNVALGASGASMSYGGRGGGGQASGLVKVTNSGAIHTEGHNALGLYAQSVGGGGGAGGMTIAGALQGVGGGVAMSMGREGGDGGNGGEVNVTSNADVTTAGDNATGLFVQSVGGGGGSGGYSIAGATGAIASASLAIGGAGADGGDGGTVAATVTGAYTTKGEFSHGLLAQSVGGGGGTGGVAAAGSASLTLGSAVVAMGGEGGDGGNGGQVTFDYDGDVATQGFGAYGVTAQSVGGGGGNGGFTGAISASTGSGAGAVALGGTGGHGGVGAGAFLEQDGTVFTQGAQAFGVLVQSVGGGGGNGGFASSAATSDLISVAVSVGGHGGVGGEGGAAYGTVNGDVMTTGKDATAVLAQSIGGGGGNGGFAAAGTIAAAGVPNQLALTLGGNGETGGAGGEVYLNGFGHVVTTGDDANGLMAQSIGGGGGHGGFSYSGAVSGANALNTALSMGGFGGIGGQGGYVNLLNTGTVGTTGRNSLGIFAQSIGGGGGHGGSSGAMTLAASNSISTTLNVGGRGGNGGIGGDVDVENDGAIETTGEGAGAIFAQSTGGGGGAGGLAGVDISQFLQWQAGISTATGFGTNTYNVSLSLGGFGGTGNDSGKVTVKNTGSAVTHGDDANVIHAESTGGGGGHAGLSAAVAGAIGASSNGSLAIAIGGNGGVSGDGGDVSVDNDGLLHAYGAGSGGIFAESIGGGGGNGGNAKGMATALGYTQATNEESLHGLTISIGGQAGAAGDGGAITVDNSGTIITEGAQAIGIFAESTGGGGGSGGNVTGSGGEIQSVLKTAVQLSNGGKGDTFGIAVGGNGGAIGDGGAITVTNSGLIQTLGDGSHGVFAHSIGGGGGNGGAGSPGRISLGGQGGSHGDGGAVTVTNSGRIATSGAIARGIFAQSVGGGGGVGGATNFSDDSFSSDDSTRKIIMDSFGQVTSGGAGLLSFIKSFNKPEYGIEIGGFGGSGGDGGDVTVDNTGIITTTGTLSHGIFAQSIGGGGGTGGEGTIGKLGNVAVSGPGGTAGDGGNVIVTNSGDIVTSGFGAMGIFSQSVGGGGGVAGDSSMGIVGLANVPGVGDYRDYGGLSLNPLTGDGGDGGDVTVTNTGNITTTGAGAVGIFAESIGGGGGLYGSAVGLGFAGALGNAGDSGKVTVIQNGNVYAAGLNALGAFFQSDTAHGRGDITATINGDVHGGSVYGAGALVDGGTDNTINLNGWTQAESGMALRSTIGNDTFNLARGMRGNADLGSGVNALNIGAQAAIVSGDYLKLGGAGSGTLTNAGIIAPGDIGHNQVTRIDGDFVQTQTGRYYADVSASASDRLDVSGTATVGGQIITSAGDQIHLTPGQHDITLVQADGGLTSTASLTAPSSALIDYSLKTTANALSLSYDLDFARLGTSGNRNRIALGQYVNAVQTAGGADSFDPTIGMLFAQDSQAKVAAIYDSFSPEPYVANLHGLAGSADRFHDGLMSCSPEMMPRGPGDRCIWVRAEGSQSKLDAGPDSLGFKSRASGVNLGFEDSAGEHARIGFALGAETVRTDVDGFSHTDGDQYHLGITAKAHVLGLDLTAAAQTGWGDYETLRIVPLPAGGTAIATGEQSADYTEVALRASHTFKARDWYVKPVVEVAQIDLHTSGTTETGASTGLQLAQTDQSRTRVTAAIEAGANIDLGKVTLRPYIRLGYSQFSRDGDLTSAARLLGAPQDVDGFATHQSTGKSLTTVEAGMSMQSDDPYGLRGRITVEQQTGDDYTSSAISLKLIKPF